MILEETDVADLVSCIELHDKVLLLPLQHGQVTFLATNEDMLAILCHRHTVVWPEISQSQVKNVLRVLDRQCFLELGLSYLQCPLALRFSLDETVVFRIEKLVGLSEAGFDFFLQNARFPQRS